MHIKILLFACCFSGSCLATDYIYPGNAVAPLTLENNDTLTVNSGVFDGGTTFTVQNSPTTTGQSVTIANGATLSSGTYGIYAPYNGPFTILNNGTLLGTVAAIMGSGSGITLTQDSTTTIFGLINFGPNAQVNFNSSAGTDNFLYVGQDSTINFNGTGSPINGIVGAAGTTINVNNTITLAPISFVDTININAGTTTLGNVSGLGTALNIASGATVALGANSISGVGNINQAGIFTSTSTTSLAAHTGIFTSSDTTTFAGQTLVDDFRVTDGTTTVTGVGSFKIGNICTLSGGTLDAGQTILIVDTNMTLHQTGGTLKVNSSGVAGSFQLNAGSTYRIDGGIFDRGAFGTTTWTNANFVMNGGTLNYANGITMSGGTFTFAGGTFNYTATDPITINGGTLTFSGGILNASGTGSIFANPNTTINIFGGDLSFLDSVVLNNNVTVNIAGTPTIVLNGGQTILSNIGVNFNIAFASSSLPTLQLPNTGADYSNTTINITNNSNLYVAAGDYVVINAGGLIIPGILNLPANNQFVQYSFGAKAGGFGEEAFVRVTRTSLDSLTTNVYSQRMGSFLDQVAASIGGTNSSITTALSNLQNSGAANIDENLFQLSPQFVTTFPLLNTVEMVFQQIGTRFLANRKPEHYSSGDKYTNSDFWMAPFGAYARQDTDNFLSGYVNKSGGISIGTERRICSTIVGLAGSFMYSWVTPTEDTSSHTTIQTYQLTGYGTFNFTYAQHLDWVLAYNSSSNHGNRDISLVNAIATAKYRANLYAAKVIYSKDILPAKNLTFSPEFNMEYVYLHQNGYDESGAGALNYRVVPISTSLYRIAAGAWITMLQDVACCIAVPQLYAAATYDIKSANQNFSANLVNTTPIFAIHTSMPRYGALFGGRITFKVKGNLNLCGDVSILLKGEYIEKYADLHLTYFF